MMIYSTQTPGVGEEQENSFSSKFSVVVHTRSILLAQTPILPKYLTRKKWEEGKFM